MPSGAPRDIFPLYAARPSPKCPTHHELDLAEIDSKPRTSRALSLARRSEKRPQTSPRELLHLPVPSFQKMVLGGDLSASSGEALQWRRREGCSGQPPAPAPLPLSPRSDLRRSIAILRSTKKDTPSPDGFVKETLGNFMFPPAVRGDFRRRRFAGLKTYFRRFKGKGAIRYLQFCHWD